MNILVVDDDNFFLKMLESQLTDLGYHSVVLCRDGMDAVRAIGKSLCAIDVVFCDLQMPIVDGIELLKKLASIKYTGGVILISGDNNNLLNVASDLAETYKIKVLGVLEKPIESMHLSSILGMAESIILSKKADTTSNSSDEILFSICENKFQNYYAPIMDLRSGDMCAVRSSMYWNHPLDGMIDTMQHFRTAHNGEDAYEDLLKEFICNAVNDIKIWTKIDFFPSVIIPIVPRVCEKFDLAHYLINTLNANRIKNKIIFELHNMDESYDYAQLLEVLARLKLNNIRIALKPSTRDISLLRKYHYKIFDHIGVNYNYISSIKKSCSKNVEANIVAYNIESESGFIYAKSQGCSFAAGDYIGIQMSSFNISEMVDSYMVRKKELFGVNSFF